MYSPEGMAEIAERLLNEIKYKFGTARKSIVRNPVLKHTVRNIPLPYRTVSKSDCEKARKTYDAFIQKYGSGRKPVELEQLYTQKGITPFGLEFDAYCLSIAVLERRDDMEKKSVYNMEGHFIRVGDIAIATNSFELFTVYGLMIKARSTAQQTFISQLSCDCADYLPTKDAIERGGYSALISDNKVGPEGGRLLVDYSVKYINELWE
jgi:hypothetical protein